VKGGDTSADDNAQPKRRSRPTLAEQKRRELINICKNARKFTVKNYLDAVVAVVAEFRANVREWFFVLISLIEFIVYSKEKGIIIILSLRDSLTRLGRAPDD